MTKDISLSTRVHTDRLIYKAKILGYSEFRDRHSKFLAGRGVTVDSFLKQG